ncbi:MAG: AAA family ATPase [Candidatus Rokubacteria bacterium]|nr:AAA family ATPase [Candidatus Rokubacteria bacterium]
MQCPRCQQENPPAAKFCNGCGGRLEAICPGCAHPNPPSSRFCNECGQQLDLAVAPAPATKPVSPEAYTPKHLAEKILTSKSALEGERKQVTVLFADLKGSMELLADRDPEEARKLLDPVLERMMEAVHCYEGTVNQVMGDGIMALFGAPVAHEDHAVRACYAALRMQEAVKRYAEEVHRTAGVPVHIRVGLNSGEVVVRSIGSDLHMDYTAVGQTTHLAARMEQMAMPGAILVTPETLRLAEGYVVVKPLGPRPVKGLDTPIEVYEVAGAAAVRSRLHAAAARGLTRFVGRDRELEQLHQALERAGSGRGQVVAVVGEAGVGKSRLYWEFAHSHRTQGWLILESSSVSYGRATAYLPLIDLLRAYFEMEGRDDPRKIREKVTGKLLSLDRALEPAVPAFLWLLDVPVEDADWRKLDPPQRRQRTLDAAKRLLLRESQVQPVLVMFEDLHWIDAETQAFLDSLVESLPTARLLLLVNYRPEYQHAWSAKTYYHRLRIDPLPPETADALLGALLGEDPTLGPLKRLLIERTDGNPFFLEESVRTLVETKVLAGERAAYRLAKAVESIQIPTTAQAIVAARIDRLAPEDKRLLQAAAVIGKDVPFALLEVAGDGSPDALRRGLTQLQTAEFLYETRLFPDLEYTFRHALTHQVAYSSVLQERRRALHARIAEAIERLYPDRLAEELERLAHHALRGEVWSKALRYLRQAGRKANSRCAFREAASYFEQALASLRHLPESRETTEQAVDLRFDLRNVLIPLGELGPILDHLHEAERLAQGLGDQRRVGRAASLLTHYFQLMGDQDRAVEAGERARTIATELGDRPLELAANLYLGQAHFARGEYRQTVRVLTKNEEILRRDEMGDRFSEAVFRLVTTRTWSVWALAELGEFSEGLALGREALKIAERFNHAGVLVSAYLGIGALYLRQGELDQAVEVLDRGVALSQAASIPAVFPFLATGLGSAYALSGRMGEALPLLEAAVEQAASLSISVGQSLRVAEWGEALLLAGRADDGLGHARRALELSREHQERGYEAYALRLLGEAVARRDRADPEAAEPYYRQALALADELGMRPLVARCHLGLGSLSQRAGDETHAEAHLATATALFREMDMGFWLAQVEAALGKAGR